MHTHSSTINSGRTLRPWELALLLAVCVTLLTGTWAQARSALLAMGRACTGANRMRAPVGSSCRAMACSCRCAMRCWPISSRSLPA